MSGAERESRVRQFIETAIAAARWFEPDGAPDPRWLVVSAPTWKDAYFGVNRAAIDAARLVLLRGGKSEADYDDFGRALFDVMWREHVAASAAVDAALVAARRKVAARQAMRTVARAIKASLAAWPAIPDPDGVILTDRYGPFEEIITAAGRYVQAEALAYDLPIAPEHRQIIADMWLAYQKGYWPYGIVDGTLYVAGLLGVVDTPTERP